MGPVNRMGWQPVIMLSYRKKGIVDVIKAPNHWLELIKGGLSWAGLTKADEPLKG